MADSTVYSSTVRIKRSVGRPSSFENALTLWAVRVAEEVQRQQVEKDFVATGESLDNYVVNVVKRNNVDLLIPQYLTYSMEGTGRKPGTVPNINALEKWIHDKGIEPDAGQTINSLAWAMGIKMAEEGNQVYRGDREGIELIETIEKSFSDNADDMAMIVANAAADALVVNFKKSTVKNK